MRFILGAVLMAELGLAQEVARPSLAAACPELAAWCTNGVSADLSCILQADPSVLAPGLCQDTLRAYLSVPPRTRRWDESKQPDFADRSRSAIFGPRQRQNNARRSRNNDNDDDEDSDDEDSEDDSDDDEDGDNNRPTVSDDFSRGRDAVLPQWFRDTTRVVRRQASAKEETSNARSWRRHEWNTTLRSTPPSSERGPRGPPLDASGPPEPRGPPHAFGDHNSSGGERGLPRGLPSIDGPPSSFPSRGPPLISNHNLTRDERRSPSDSDDSAARRQAAWNTTRAWDRPQNDWNSSRFRESWRRDSNDNDDDSNSTDRRGSARGPRPEGKGKGDHMRNERLGKSRKSRGPAHRARRWSRGAERSGKTTDRAVDGKAAPPPFPPASPSPQDQTALSASAFAAAALAAAFADVPAALPVTTSIEIADPANS